MLIPKDVSAYSAPLSKTYGPSPPVFMSVLSVTLLSVYISPELSSRCEAGLVRVLMTVDTEDPVIEEEIESEDDRLS